MLAVEQELMARGQAEVLVPMIGAAMKSAAVAFEDLGLIAVTVGPGAFTGIRIGLAAARGFAVASGVPVAGVSTLDVLAASAAKANPGKPILALIDTKRGDLYAGRYEPDRGAIDAPSVMTPQELQATGGDFVFCGDGAAQIGREADVLYPDPVVLARLASDRHAAGAALPPEPLYLRPPLAKLPKDGGRLRP